MKHVTNRILRYTSSLKVVLSTAILLVIIIFVLLSTQTYIRLVEINDTFEAFNSEAIPAISNSNMLYSEVNSLTYLTERMSDSKTFTELRINQNKLTQQILTVTKIAGHLDSSSYFRTQLNTVIEEILALNKLINEHLTVQQKIISVEERFFEAYERIDSNGNPALKPIYSRVLASIGKLNVTYSLLTARKIELTLKESLRDARTIDNINNEDSLVVQDVQNIQRLLLGDNGLLELKIHLIRLRGRVTGRTNFMHNLILDYANQAEYLGYQQKLRVEKLAEKDQDLLQEQIYKIGTMSLAALAVLLVIMWVLNVRIVKRLTLLDDTIKRKLHGEIVNIDSSGNDEIADIAYSFNLYYKTVMQQQQILEELSLSDGLTGISNRRAFDTRLQSEIETAYREGWNISILMIDVDSFKPYNDNYGHDAGDKCLQAISATLKNSLPRSSDFIARYGGEEFSCILQNTDIEGAKLVAQRLVDAVYQQQLKHEFSIASDRVTVSIGVSTHDYDKDRNHDAELVKNADKALYEAKESGRNGYAVFTSTRSEIV